MSYDSYDSWDRMVRRRRLVTSGLIAVGIVAVGAGTVFAVERPESASGVRAVHSRHLIPAQVARRTGTELRAQADAQQRASRSRERPEDTPSGPVQVPPPTEPPRRPAKERPADSPVPPNGKRAPAVGRQGGDQASPDTSDASSWYLPVTEHRITAGYGQSGPWASGHHTGTDFPVPVGTRVVAAGDGTVVTAGWDRAYGNQVEISHPDGTYTQYAHLSVLAVRPGQRVHGGQRIGLSGATGNVTGPHLHFEARTAPGYGHDVDPVAWLRTRGVTL
ncbi:M23 family metallopeptidase [Streptomyces sp. AK02-01A]|uniref:M23 family metallopeptidase n=1 Tax=Streptomyces sp. AK02-01A TaxID=3028648 RepID=UPI00299FEB4C|nr:M23 family metallopeptidase [Streptomyces sp. AK02-01A]MDX3850986.1 M23 family metallopeptidase [Streptomyces sp. AK02-01A]